MTAFMRTPAQHQSSYQKRKSSLDETCGNVQTGKCEALCTFFKHTSCVTLSLFCKILVLYCHSMWFTHCISRCKVYFTSCLPPEQAKDKGVSLVLSDWASISAPLSSKISTTPTWPAVAAKMSGVNPETENMTRVTAPEEQAWRFHIKCRFTRDY